MADLTSTNKENVGDASVFFRPLRQLIDSGKPLPPITTVAFAPTEHGPLPFGAFARTKKNRLIFWPVPPADLELYKDNGQPLTVDHLTLEFPAARFTRRPWISRAVTFMRVTAGDCINFLTGPWRFGSCCLSRGLCFCVRTSL
jgi:hypothetical protein